MPETRRPSIAVRYLVAWVLAGTGGCQHSASGPGTAAPAEQVASSPSPPETQAQPEPVASGETTPRPPLTIFRAEIDRALRHGPGYLLAQLGPEPFRVGGHVVGWKITRVFPDAPELAAQCDLRPGDVVLSVNGDPLATPTALSAMLDRLPELDVLVVTRLRDTQREVIHYALVENRHDAR